MSSSWGNLSELGVTGQRQTARAPEAVPTIRVAVASADGKFVHQHFGRATHFQIFSLSGDTLRFIETRRADPICRADGHDSLGLQKAIDLVGDADVVLVAAIGPAAEVALNARGIRVFAVQDFIPSALQALQKAVARLYPHVRTAIRENKE